MRKAISPVLATFAVVLGFVVGRRSSEAHALQQAPTNYLLIDECRMPAGVSPTDAIAKASHLVGELRKTGEYKSVRLFGHFFGTDAALYTISEPRSWAAFEAGFSKMVQANPSLMTTPYHCGGHSDNLLTEVVVP